MRLRNRRGSVVVLIAVLMVVLLGFGAFAVDIAQVQAYKSELKRTADAAALAAALQLNHETAFHHARDTATAFVARNPVLRDTAQLTVFEYGRWIWQTGTFDPLLCNPACGVASIDSATAVRVRVSGSGRFYLAQFLGRDAFNVYEEAIAALPVTATPCAAPFALDDTIWTARYPGSLPSAATLRNQPIYPPSQKVFAVKYSDPSPGGTDAYFGAVNLPAYPAASPQPNGVLNYALNIERPTAAPPYQVPCHVVEPGDTLQAKRTGLNAETIDGVSGFGGATRLCASLTASDCYGRGGQIGVAARIPIVRDATVPPCRDTHLYPEDVYPSGTVKCLVVVDVRTFVITHARQSGAEQGFVRASYAGNRRFGPVRSFAQRPILVR